MLAQFFVCVLYGAHSHWCSMYMYAFRCTKKCKQRSKKRGKRIHEPGFILHQCKPITCRRYSRYRPRQWTLFLQVHLHVCTMRSKVSLVYIVWSLSSRKRIINRIHLTLKPVTFVSKLFSYLVSLRDDITKSKLSYGCSFIIVRVSSVSVYVCVR